MTKESVDARGLSCPEPVLLSKRAMERIERGIVEVLVDTATSRDNISRMAKHMGWGIESEQQEDGAFLLRIRKE